jgi:7-cyano-7-deazaguanine synthase
MDSMVATAKASCEYDDLITVSVGYGSLHECNERLAAEKLSKYFGSNHYVLTLPNVFEGQSALMGASQMPHLTYAEITKTIGPSPTVVPFRNANLISLATAIAAAEDAQAVYIGVHAEDARNFAYPDCTPEFIGAMAAAVYIGTYNKVHLVAPLQYYTKVDVLKVAVDLELPLEETWSCYDPKCLGAGDLSVGLKDLWAACGLCPTCVERIEAFKDLGFIDPVPYAIDIDWGDCVTLMTNGE